MQYLPCRCCKITSRRTDGYVSSEKRSKIVLGRLFPHPRRRDRIVRPLQQWSRRDFPARQRLKIVMKADDPLGMQIIIERRIAAKEIVKIRPLPQVIGGAVALMPRERRFVSVLPAFGAVSPFPVNCAKRGSVFSHPLRPTSR